MASPSLQSRFVHNPGTGAKRRYGESSARTLVGLQKVDVQLQKEIDKLERQAQTAVTNIANHQQAIKMSWRRLEHRRNMESPLLSQKQRHAVSNSPKVRKTVLFSNTRLSAAPGVFVDTDKSEGRVSSTPSLNVTEDDDRSESSSTPHLITPSHPPITSMTRPKHLQASPYISSPYNYRRVVSKKRGPSLLTVTTSGAEPRPNTSPGDVAEGGVVRPRERTRSASDLKLPPISPQPTLVTHTNTMDKNTLMKASALMGLDSHSKGPQTFKDFYSSERPPSRGILLSSPVAVEEHNEITSERSSDPATGGDDNEAPSNEPSTLEELFEQIRHCRYIRHYNPDGTTLEEFL